MWIDSLADMPTQVYVATAVVVIAEPNYAIMTVLSSCQDNEEDIRRDFAAWEKQYAIVYKEVKTVRCTDNRDEVRDKLLSALQAKENKILAERQKELDEVRETRQNLLALPSPTEGDFL